MHRKFGLTPENRPPKKQSLQRPVPNEDLSGIFSTFERLKLT